MWVLAVTVVVLIVSVVVAVRGLAGSGRHPTPGVVAHLLPGSGAWAGVVDVAVDGGQVWVLRSSSAGDTVLTELDATDGRVVRSVTGARYGWRRAIGIAVDGGRVWVTSEPTVSSGRTPLPGSGVVTEVDAATGDVVRVLTGVRYGFSGPGAVIAVGARVWVANEWVGSLSELDATTGRLLRIVPGATAGLSAPTAMAVVDGRLWVVGSLPDRSDGGGVVTELDAADGHLIRTLTGGPYGFQNPSGIVAAGGHLWVTNLHAAADGGSVTEIDPTDGRWVRTVAGGCTGLLSPVTIAGVGMHLWVVNGRIDHTGGPTLTELDATDGRWVRTLADPGASGVLEDFRCDRQPSTQALHLHRPGILAAVRGRLWVFGQDGVAVVEG